MGGAGERSLQMGVAVGALYFVLFGQIMDLYKFAPLFDKLQAIGRGFKLFGRSMTTFGFVPDRVDQNFGLVDLILDGLIKIAGCWFCGEFLKLRGRSSSIVADESIHFGCSGVLAVENVTSQLNSINFCLHS